MLKKKGQAKSACITFCIWYGSIPTSLWRSKSTESEGTLGPSRAAGTVKGRDMAQQAQGSPLVTNMLSNLLQLTHKASQHQ